MIELLDLSVCLGGRTVLDRLTGSFNARSLGLLGPNGAGKSTLINTLLGFYAPSTGSARLLGFDPQRSSKDVRALVGYMPENDAFIASMTGIHFVRYMAELSGIPSREALERAHQIFVQVGLGEARYRKLGTYSIGMKQLAKLAQALVHGPKLLFLDEPTNGLDPAARQRMLRLIQEVRDAGQTHLVISSHLLHDVEELCDEVMILKQGRIAARADLEAERRRHLRLLELDLAGDPVGFARAIAAHGGECATFDGATSNGATSNGVHASATGQGARLRLVLPPAFEVRTLYELAESHTVLIRRLSYRHDSLEELFLDTMRDAHTNASCIAGDRLGRLPSDAAQPSSGASHVGS